jgi:hypothetical protein
LRLTRIACVAALLCSSTLEAQSASYTFFGTGCGNPTASPFLAAGLPQLGGRVDVTTFGSWFGITRFVLTGFSNTSWGGVPLPLPVPGACGSLLVSGELVSLVPFCSNGHLHRSVSLPIPNDASLLGLVFYQQGVGIVGGAMEFTRGGRGQIGT